LFYKLLQVLCWFNVFAVDLVEVCHPKNCNIGLLSYSPLGGGALTGKYIDINSAAAKKGRLNLFPGYMERYNKSIARVHTNSCPYI
jgi:aryl-alcohol dehydrogenase-like predicted oxidoreductase